MRNYFIWHLKATKDGCRRRGFYWKWGRLIVCLNVPFAFHPCYKSFVKVIFNYTPEQRYICQLKYGEEFKVKDDDTLYIRSWVHYTCNMDCTAYDVKTMSAHIFDWLAVVEDV